MPTPSTFARFDRRMLLRGALAVTAASWVPRRSYAADAVSSTGETVMLSDAAIADLQKSIKGSLVLPSNPEYDTARRVWSPNVNKYPALIAKVTSVEDIQATIQFARRHNLLTAVKCGGHEYNGHGMADKGLTIDLGGFGGVQVDKTKKLAFVNGGAMLGELDEATIPSNLAVTNGTANHTGIGGLATGLGQGRLSRVLGYTIDNLRSIELITPEGKLVRANAKENPDLFWAVRGGGGNFGIVTKFELQLHEIDPNNLTSFGYTFPVAKAKDVLKYYFEMADKVPNEMALSSGVTTAENGEISVSFNGNFWGSPEEAQKLLAGIDRFGEPTRKRFDKADYLKVQSAGAGPKLSTRTLYMHSGFFDKVDSKIPDVVVDRLTKAPMPRAGIRFSQQAGAASKVAANATAYPYRKVLHQCAADGNWLDPKDGPALRQYANESWDLLKPMSNGGFYINYYCDPTEDDMKRAYGANYEKLSEVKAKYDPTNFMKLNFNIKPKGSNKRASR